MGLWAADSLHLIICCQLVLYVLGGEGLIEKLSASDVI